MKQQKNYPKNLVLLYQQICSSIVRTWINIEYIKIPISVLEAKNAERKKCKYSFLI